MRRYWMVPFLLFFAGCSSTHLSRSFARREIAHIGPAQLSSSAVEIRSITPQGPDLAIVETTVALAFQFRRDNDTDEWRVDAVRMGSGDWVNMTELLTALNGGTPPPPRPSTPPPTVPRTDRFHISVTDFDEIRQRLIELGSSSLIPAAIEIRRVISQNDLRAIAECTVSFGFRFKRDVRTNQWRIEAARLGQHDWIVLDDLLAVMNEGRRRDTEVQLQKLVIGIDNFRKKNGTLPQATDIVKLTDVLHPTYMPDL